VATLCAIHKKMKEVLYMNELTAASQLATEPAETQQSQNLVQTTDAFAASPDLDRLLTGQTNLSLQPVTQATHPVVVDTALPVAIPDNKARRRGRIARLPKIQRDMVKPHAIQRHPIQEHCLGSPPCGLPGQ
jgi:hypothetical protein